MKAVPISRRGIEATLPKVAEGLEQYLSLQAELPLTNVANVGCDFQRRFNRFNRVRRDAAWRSAFYGLLEKGKSKRPTLAAVLRSLHRVAGRVEASFASKLIATLDPSQPVIDSKVFRILRLSLPPRTETTDRRIDGVVARRDELASGYAAFLKTETGRFLVRRFREQYPRTGLTEVKMLDLILWKAERTDRPR